MSYYRTNGGRTVHLGSCRHNVNSTYWGWAEGQPAADLRIQGPAFGWKLCRVCLPEKGDHDEANSA